MTESIPAAFLDVLESESIAHVATVDPNGAPHVTPVWVDYDDETGQVLVNTARGRRKERNLRSDPRVAVSVLDPANPYRHVTLRGEATTVTEEGADEHIDQLASQYLGVDEYPGRDDEEGERVVVRIRPDSVSTMHRPDPTPTGFLRYALRRAREAITPG